LEGLPRDLRELSVGVWRLVGSIKELGELIRGQSVRSVVAVEGRGAVEIGLDEGVVFGSVSYFHLSPEERMEECL
jgi:hypothetical protein